MQVIDANGNMFGYDYLEVIGINGKPKTLGGGVTSVTASTPLLSSGGTTPNISMFQASAAASGYLSATDWLTFNGKQASLVSGGNIKTINGNSLLGSGNLVVGGSSGTHFNYPIVDGNIYHNQTNGNSIFTGNGIVQNAIWGPVFSTDKNVQARDISIQIVGGGVGRLCKIVVYSSNDTTNWTLVGNSTDINCDVSGVKTWSSANVNFVTGKYYTVSAIGNATMNTITLNNATFPSMGAAFNVAGNSPTNGIAYTVGSYTVPSSFTTNHTQISVLTMFWFKLYNI
jgi:hypothetical protein